MKLNLILKRPAHKKLMSAPTKIPMLRIFIALASQLSTTDACKGGVANSQPAPLIKVVIVLMNVPVTPQPVPNAAGKKITVIAKN